MRHTVCPFALALFLLVAVAPSVNADVGVPGMRPARPTHRIVATEDFPNHVFVLYRPKSLWGKDTDTGKEGSRDTSEAEYVRLSPDNSVVVELDPYQALVVLLIIPRATAASFRSALELAKEVLAKPQQVEGVVRYDLSIKEDVPLWQRAEITITHRVQRVGKSSTLEVARVTPGQGYQCWVVGLLSPIAVVLGGAWLIRWLRRRKKAATEPQA